MSQFITTAITQTPGSASQIFAKLSVRLAWADPKSNENVSTSGVTDHVSDTKVLVNVDVLPPVGVPVEITIADEDKELITVKGYVIRVERNIAKPKVALSLANKKEEWQDVLLPAAQAWVTNDLQVNYSDDDWLN